MRGDFGFFGVVGVCTDAEGLVICFFFLEKLQNQLMIALLILAINILVEPKVVFKGFPDVG